MTSPEVTRLDVESVGGMIETSVAEMGARRVLVDSISHFERLTPDSVELRSLQYSFINGLKREGLTSLLTRESPTLLGEAPEAIAISLCDRRLPVVAICEIGTIRRACWRLNARGSPKTFIN
jgi:hypothetical protein